MIGKLVALPVRLGSPREVVSGVYQHNPTIYGRLADQGCGKDVAFIVMHPTNNFMNHWLLEPLQQRGRAVLGLNSRYIGNELNLLVERTLQDLGAGVRFLREQGYRRICLVGNSGGGALVSLYQAEAEKLTIMTTPDGRPIDTVPSDLPPADSIAIIAAHTGRARTLTVRMDAAVIDEADLTGTDPALDIFNPDHGPPFSTEFVTRVRAAQLERNRRITAWCQARLREYGAERFGGAVTDCPILIHRTHADPRYLDLTLDPNDRPTDPGGKRAAAGNYAANNLGRVSTARSWLSQWSQEWSRSDGPATLQRTSVPVLLVYHTADATIFPSDYEEWSRAAVGRAERIDLKGMPHYPYDHPDKLRHLADILAEWAARG